MLSHLNFLINVAACYRAARGPGTEPGTFIINPIDLTTCPRASTKVNYNKNELENLMFTYDKFDRCNTVLP